MNSNYTQETVPEQEVISVEERLKSHPDYFIPKAMIEAYRPHVENIFPDPFGAEVTKKISNALRNRQPYSVIRLGDGEANILAFDRYPDTPALDRHCAWHAISTQFDTMDLEESWFLVLRDLMHLSILSADIVGVLGFWRPTTNAVDKIDHLADRLRARHASITGHWRGIDMLLQYAKYGYLRGKVAASAHLYLGVIARLKEIIDHAQRTICITNRTDAVARIQSLHPTQRVDHIEVGRLDAKPDATGSASFLVQVSNQLPCDMHGTLCLIGAGPWAEIYSTWVKQRGGVAVDIGSGFDLIRGQKSRPVHNKLAQEYLDTLSASIAPD